MSRVIGIDLGTSTSEVAILEDGKPVVIPAQSGETIIPSVVGISHEGDLLIGTEARDQLLLRPRETVMEVKRLMGTGEKVSMGDREYTPQEISAYILEHLKENAERYLGDKVDRAVITVPAYFTDEQRRATVEAGRLAGFKVERIINEPTAAALAYGVSHMENNEHILVYDLGGGTLDVTVLEMFDGVLEVKASSGNNALGGKDFDQRLMDDLTGDFKNIYGIDIKSDIRAMARLKEAAEKCKIALSHQEEYEISLPFLAEKNGEPVALQRTITREYMESLIIDLVESSEKPIQIVLKDAGLSCEDIDIVFMVGGSTRIPLIREFLKNALGREPRTPVDPDLAVVMGAAIQGAIINGELSQDNDILITDVCPYTLGVEILKFIAGIPVPDNFDVIIPRNTTIPVVRDKIYGTAADNQEQVEIKVFQGDYRKASHNNFLGKFILDGIPPAPAFKEKVKVSFTYDINGILQVEGTIVSSGKKTGITIETTGVNMEEEVDLTKWKEAPRARKYRPLIRRAERFLENNEEDLAVDLDSAIRDLKKALVTEADEEELEILEEELNDLLYDLEGED